MCPGNKRSAVATSNLSMRNKLVNKLAKVRSEGLDQDMTQASSNCSHDECSLGSDC